MQGKPYELLQYIYNLDKDKNYEIKEVKEKRSLDSNAYCWVLINKIANEIRKSKEEVYLEMLKHYGQSTMVSILSSIDVSGYFKYWELSGTSILNDKEFSHYKIYKGSSEYDTKEMSILIEGIIQEANDLGIETLTPEELAKMRNLERNIK